MSISSSARVLCGVQVHLARDRLLLALVGERARTHSLTPFKRLSRTHAEAAQTERHHSSTAAFLQAATKDVYGAAAGGGAPSLQDAVGRRKFFSDRTGASGFRK